MGHHIDQSGAGILDTGDITDASNFPCPEGYASGFAYADPQRLSLTGVVGSPVTAGFGMAIVEASALVTLNAPTPNYVGPVTVISGNTYGLLVSSGSSSSVSTAAIFLSITSINGAAQTLNLGDARTLGTPGQMKGVISTEFTILSCPCSFVVHMRGEVFANGGATASVTDPFFVQLPPGWTYSIASAPAGPPSISSISPNPVVAGVGVQNLFINGAGFQNGPGLTVHVSNGNFQTDLSGAQVTFLSSTQLSISLDVGTAAASWTATVTNPDSQGSSAFPFNVVVPSTSSFALPQFVFGGGWYTALYFVNTTNLAAQIPVHFYDDNGAPLPVQLLGIGSVSSQSVTVNPHSTAILEAPNTGGIPQEGWADVALPSGVTGYAVFRQTVAGRADQEAVVPLTPESSQTADLTYDDTNFTTSVAFLNPTASTVTVTINTFDATGASNGTTQLVLNSRAKMAVVLKGTSGLSGIVGSRGHAVFSVTSGAVSVLGLRFGGSAFTSIPVVHRPTNPVTQTVSFALPQFVFGTPWYTALYFSNTTNSAVVVPVNFTDNNGVALPVQLNGIGTDTSQIVLLAPGATAILEAPLTDASGEGWANVALPPGVTEYAVFRQTVAGRFDQEAVVPLTPEGSQAADLIYDDTAFSTAVAFLNPSDQQVTVTITVYSANGSQIGTTQVLLAPNAKVATVLRSEPGLSAMVGNRGWASFSVPNGDVSVLGLRFGGSAFTSIPVAHR